MALTLAPQDQHAAPPHIHTPACLPGIPAYVVISGPNLMTHMVLALRWQPVLPGLPSLNSVIT